MGTRLGREEDVVVTTFALEVREERVDEIAEAASAFTAGEGLGLGFAVEAAFEDAALRGMTFVVLVHA